MSNVQLVQLRRFGFHNLRHSLASFLVRKGTDAKTVQAVLRHSDVTTTLGIYAHSMSEDRLAAQDDMLAAMMTKSNAVNWRYRKSIARAVLAARPNCRATRRTAALHKLLPPPPSKRLPKRALLGSSATFSALIPQSGHRTR